MKIYLVGGAIRDQLLGLPIKERDYVVVGATVEDMLQRGYRQVGKDFPVFLHPQTQEEYALARKERKVGPGYKGFTFDASPDVTLEEDLSRRDLTINAMAQTEEGKLIDPYNGQKDLREKKLRHVSPAFIEDPVRILRVARFAARFHHLGFSVAEDTNDLMKKMVQQGEVNALVAERVWKELERALTEKNPEQFFEVLENCAALKILFPNITADSITALISATKQSEDPQIRFAALLGKNTEQHIKALCDKYRVPTDYKELALLGSRYLSDYQRVTELSAEEILNVLKATDAFRREDRFNKFLQVCKYLSEADCSQFFQQCFDVTKNIDTKDFIGLPGKEIAEKILQERISRIQELQRR